MEMLDWRKKPNQYILDMPKSSAFIQIKAGVIAITSNIPVARVTTYSAIGEHLNVMPRHIAYILTMLNLEEKLALPWYRVVAEKGAISLGKLTARHHTQIDYLQQEGIQITTKNRIDNFDELFCSPRQLVDWDRHEKYYLKDDLIQDDSESSD
jgi:methylated-DNA-protein-cysteine methyltransferase related protein